MLHQIDNTLTSALGLEVESLRCRASGDNWTAVLRSVTWIGIGSHDGRITQLPIPLESRISQDVQLQQEHLVGVEDNRLSIN